MERTNSYTYFGIQSNGTIEQNGLVAFEKGIFNPADVTKSLDIQPFNSWSYGDKRRNGSTYLFSNWDAEKSDADRLDIGAQCLDTISNLKKKIPILRQIKQQFDVNFVIMIVPIVYGEELPIMTLNKEIIEFCNLTETTIEMDMYISRNNEEL